jgi:serine protease inhibitor
MNISHSKAIDNRLLERSQLFNVHSKTIDVENNTDKPFILPGEISPTAMSHNLNIKGMPARWSLDTDRKKKVLDENDMSKYYFPFDLNSKKPTNNISDIVCKFTGVLSYSFKNNSALVDQYCLSPLGIIYFILSMYLGTADRNVREMQQYFGFSDDNIVFEETMKLNKIISPIFEITTIYVVSNKLRISKKRFPNVKVLGINWKSPSKYIGRINNFISQAVNEQTNIVNEKMFSKNNNILVLNISKFNSSWKFPFDKKQTGTSIFNGFLPRKVKIMKMKNIVLDYFEDKTFKILELPYEDEVTSFGMIMPKIENLNITGVQISSLIKQLVSTSISQLVIPKFTGKSVVPIKDKLINVKIKFLNNKFFLTEMCDDRTRIKISDIIHCSYISLDEGNQRKISFNNNLLFDENRSLPAIFMQSFFYYVRCIPTNTILLMGFYS